MKEKEEKDKNDVVKTDVDKLSSIKKQITTIIQNLTNESDRACVIIAAARAETLLGQILRKYLLPNTTSDDVLLDQDRALGTFSSRINIVYRLGLIDAELARALQILRRIRNSFAHEASIITLNEGSYSDRVREFAGPLIKYQQYESLKATIMSKKKDDSATFCAGAAVIIARLEGLLFYLEPIKAEETYTLIPKGWK